MEKFSVITNLLRRIRGSNQVANKSDKQGSTLGDQRAEKYPIPKNEVTDLKKEVADLKKENKELTNQVDLKSNNFDTENRANRAEDKPRVVTFEITPAKYIFLPSPFDEKRFSVEDASSERKGTSLYCINLDASEKDGQLSILEDADFTNALNSPELFLAKACRYENVFDYNAIRVENVKKGSVYLEGNDWIVKEKIKVKFLKK
jgi:hypothetical protein